MKLLVWCWWVILKDKKILLEKRVATKKNYPNCRTLPAGTLEEDDPTIQDAVVREVKEETNLDFVPTKKFGFYETDTEEYRIVWFVYLWERSGEIKIQESEVSDIWWFSYEETKKMPIAYSYDETIDDLHNSWLIE